MSATPEDTPRKVAVTAESDKDAPTPTPAVPTPAVPTAAAPTTSTSEAEASATTEPKGKENAPTASPTEEAGNPAEEGEEQGQGTFFLPAEHWFERPQEDEDGDGDSAFGRSSGVSSTQSLTSSILEYRTINGRRFHAERGNANYWATNDAPQAEAQDILHHVITLSIGDVLYKAPLKKGIKTCLDVGTGTGTWAIDFADCFPECQVIGTDISPTQPAWVPPNLKFEIEDCTEQWSYESNSMDFVHIRFMYGSIPDWDALFREAYRVCKPGGWVESIEASPSLQSDDDTVGPGSALHEWGRYFVEGGKIIGRTFEIIEHHLQMKGMEKAGLVDMESTNYKVPLGGWPKDPKLREIGQFMQASGEEDYEGYVSYMAKLVQGWGRKEVLVYCAHVRREVASGKYHAWYPMRAVWGRKPEQA